MFLNQLMELSGNNGYYAAMMLAKLARQLCSRYDNIITESEAISWLLSGAEPKHLQHRIWVRHWIRHRDVYFMKDVLASVEDKAVSQSVECSIRTSKQIRSLSFVYVCGCDKWQQARVRILTRWIWYNMYN